MEIDQINNISTTSPNSTNNTTSSDELGKDEFLRLLITKLQNQDPLNPTSDEAFIADLAQFSSLEQMTNINENIESLSILQSNATNTTMVNYIGKTAHIAGDTISLENGEGTIGFEIPYSAKNMTISIYNESGQLVRTIDRSQVPSGEHTYNWDGKDSNGDPLSDGRYKIKISASDGSGASIPVITRTTGIISGITYENGYPELLINGESYSLGNIITISD